LNAKTLSGTASFIFLRIPFSSVSFGKCINLSSSETEFHSKENFENYEKLVDYIGDERLDPDVLKEMQDNYLIFTHSYYNACQRSLQE